MCGGRGYIGSFCIFHLILLKPKNILKNKESKLFKKIAFYRVMTKGTCFKVRQTFIYCLFDCSLT